MKKFTSKDPVEKMLLSFDFTDLFSSSDSESIVEATWESKVKRGEDANPELMITVPQIEDNTIATCMIQGGVSGTVYVISCVVETSEGQVLKQSGILPVKTQG